MKKVLLSILALVTVFTLVIGSASIAFAKEPGRTQWISITDANLAADTLNVSYGWQNSYVSAFDIKITFPGCVTPYSYHLDFSELTKYQNITNFVADLSALTDVSYNHNYHIDLTLWGKDGKRIVGQAEGDYTTPSS